MNMNDMKSILSEIEAFCRKHDLAETTFGKQAVNDGKFVARLRAGKSVTLRTLERVRAYMESQGGVPNVKDAKQQPKTQGAKMPAKTDAPKDGEEQTAFRFYDNRQKYLMFVNTCSEKWVVAERVGMELAHLKPTPPALRVFDAGMGDGSVLTRVMRDMHNRFPHIPFLITAKEISLEDVRLGLEKMSDRFFEHPATILIVTNLYYAEAPKLMPKSISAAASLNWAEVPLKGSTSHEFDEQIKGLQNILANGWQVKSSEKTGNPLYVRPSVLVLYREDHKFMLDQMIPRPGHFDGQYDLAIASQPYRAAMSAKFKAEKVLAPIAKSIAPGGRMLVLHSYGNDPGLELVQKIWPGHDPFKVTRHDLIKELKDQLGRSDRDIRYQAYADNRSLFRYQMHTLPGEVEQTASIGTSTLFAAWNAAVYVAQVEDQLITDAMQNGDYLDATAEVLKRHKGLWFYDESFVITRTKR